MVIWQFFISEQLFLRTPFFPEHLQWVLPRIAWTLIIAENFKNFFIGKMAGAPQHPHPLSQHPWASVGLFQIS